MDSSSTLALSLLLMLFTNLHAVEESLLLPETTVTTINKMAGPVLSVHCKSKDDDLGAHILQPDGSYSFTFRPNVFGTTLFTCIFQWTETHNFAIFDFHRDGNRCTDCRWEIYRDGPCLLHPKDLGTYNVCFPWN